MLKASDTSWLTADAYYLKNKDAIQQWQASLKSADTDSQSDIEPGELAKIAKKLERGGVNIDSLFILVGASPQTEIAIGVDKPAEAQKLLDYS